MSCFGMILCLSCSGFTEFLGSMGLEFSSKHKELSGKVGGQKRWTEVCPTCSFSGSTSFLFCIVWRMILHPTTESVTEGGLISALPGTCLLNLPLG